MPLAERLNVEMTMSGSQRISGEAFAIERLRDNPDLDYSTLRREAANAGVSMQPIQYGRARKALGLPPMGKSPAPVRQTPPAPATPTTSDAADGADDDAAAEDDVPGEDGDAGDPTPTDAPAPTRSADAAASPADDLVAPRRKGSAAFDFLVQELRREPNLLYAELRERCEAKGWKIAPIMYGRAKAVLGLVPVKPRGTGKRAVASAASAAPAAPMILKQVESVAADRFQKHLADVRQVDQLVAVVKELDNDRRRLRELLERIVSMIDEALG